MGTYETPLKHTPLLDQLAHALLRFFVLGEAGGGVAGIGGGASGCGRGLLLAVCHGT